jgi:hypothetical protein
MLSSIVIFRRYENTVTFTHFYASGPQLLKCLVLAKLSLIGISLQNASQAVLRFLMGGTPSLNETLYTL